MDTRDVSFFYTVNFILLNIDLSHSYIRWGVIIVTVPNFKQIDQSTVGDTRDSKKLATK